jgi:acetyltransferase-like isoleucine patch superfamily enzyme
MTARMLYRTIAVSDHWLPRFLRWSRRKLRGFSMPAPRVLTVPLVAVFLACRNVYYFMARVFVCEPFFKSYCTKFGRNLHTGVFLPWVQGRGDLILGDDVIFDGKFGLTFAARYSERPSLIVGDGSGFGHGTNITVGKQITIGKHCRIAGEVTILDTPGHSLDPALRLEGRPATDDEVRPVVIEDNVWIGQRATIMPGVTLGRGCVVAAGAVVMTSVPPNVLVAGNPARQVRVLSKETPA